MRLNLDAKCDHAVQPMITAVRRSGAERRVLLASFSDARLARMRRPVDPDVTTSMGVRAVAKLVLGRGTWPPAPKPVLVMPGIRAGEQHTDHAAAERQTLQRLREDLAARFPHLSAAIVEAHLQQALYRFGDATVRDFVPVFVARQAQASLAALVADPPRPQDVPVVQRQVPVRPADPEDSSPTFDASVAGAAT